MPTRTVDISDKDPELSDLLSLVAEGNEVVLMDGAAAIARLVPIDQRGNRVAGLHTGAMKASNDFDGALPEEFWLGAP